MLDQLTKREFEVLGLLSEGLMNHEIGRTLFVSEQTVKFHITNILRKLSAKNRAHAVAIGYQNGLLKVDNLEITAL
jgi:DNA-binding NarL/FixJ family response regulator